MLLALSIALGLPLVAQVPVGPVVPYGVNASFQQGVLAVEEHLSKGEFDEAAKALTVVPKRNFKLRWDDEKVPAAFRPTLAGMREAAMTEWSDMLSELKPTAVATPGDLEISFADSLPETEDKLPAGATHTFSSTPGEARLKTVIALKRGFPPQPTTTLEVRNEVLYAIAAYLGVQRSPFPGVAAFRTDLPTLSQNRLGQLDVLTVGRVFKVVDELTSAVKEKRQMTPARPKLEVAPMSFQLPKVKQLDPVTFEIAVKNVGNAPASFRFVPDCGCLIPRHTPLVPPGETVTVNAMIDTANFVGDLRHKFYVYSNDVERPFFELPVAIDVAPLFRFVRQGSSVLQMSDSGVDTEVYLLLDDPEKFAFKEARLTGLKGRVEAEPWQGTVADPALGDLQGKGYKLKVHLDRSPVPGRALANLEVLTEHPIFGLLRHPIYAQRGILAMPESLYLGEISRAPTVAAFILTKPEVPFKITKIESDAPFLKATWEPVHGEWEYRVVVHYDGQSDSGPLEATLTVHTNDPKQPKIVVMVTGIVR